MNRFLRKYKTNTLINLKNSGCGGYISGFAGAISTPQYPQVDSRTLICEWQIAVALGNQIRLDFIKIDNLDSADKNGVCAPFARNFIDITSSTLPDATVLKRFCRGETSMTSIQSEGNQLAVRYNQNGGSINGGLYGFLAEFKTVCEDITLNVSRKFCSISKNVRLKLIVSRVDNDDFFHIFSSLNILFLFRLLLFSIVVITFSIFKKPKIVKNISRFIPIKMDFSIF